MSTRGGPSRKTRFRYFIRVHRSSLVALCLLLAVVGGFVAVQSFSGPDTTTERRTVATWTADGDFTHGAVVQRDTRAFNDGAVLRNRSVYFRSVAPVLNGTYVVTHSGDADPATVETDLRLVVRAVELGDQQRVLWDVSEPVASDRVTSLSPGDSVVVPYQFNVTAQSELAERVRTELGSTRGRVEVRLVAETDVSTTLSDESVDRSRTDVLAVTPRPDSYGVTEETAGVARAEVTEPVEVPVEPDPVGRYGGLAALLVGLSGAATVGMLARTGRLDIDDRTREAMVLEGERDSFDEWISTGRVPAAEDERVVTVESLADLVDVAIDSDRRVIEDTGSGAFVVLDGGTRYEYRPETERSGWQPAAALDRDEGRSGPGGAGDPLSDDGQASDDQ